MTDFLRGYSVQYWLESAPQGYLMDTVYGHGEDEVEAEVIVGDDFMRDRAITTTVQLVVGERCALAASSGLINAAPDEVCRTAERLNLDLIQLHGDEPPDFLPRLGGRPVMRAFRHLLPWLSYRGERNVMS